MAAFQSGEHMNVDFKRDQFLTDKLLVLDGLTGTGKTMISNVLESFEKVEVGRFIYDVEHIAISHELERFVQMQPEPYLVCSSIGSYTTI